MSETRIHAYGRDDAPPAIRAILDRWLEANPDREDFPAILKCFGASGDAEVLQGLLQFCYPLQFAGGKLGQRRKEMIGAYVSALNQCPY